MKDGVRPNLELFIYAIDVTIDNQDQNLEDENLYRDSYFLALGKNLAS